MKTKQYLLIVFCSLQFVIQKLHAQDIFEIDKVAFSEAERHQSHFNHTQKSASETEYYDLKYHRLVWEIDPDTNYIKGEITSYFTPIVSNFNEIYFDLTTTLIVDSVKYHHSLVTYAQLPSNSLKIDLPGIIAQNSLDSITVFYQGVPQNSGFGSFVKSSHAGQSIIWTLSEPFGALEWWPCKQSLDDKIDSIDVIVTTPKINKVASQGLLVNETDNGTHKTYHWKHRYPITTYLISLAVTNYAEFTVNTNLTLGTLPILNYVYPEDSLTSYPKVNLIKPIFELYDSLFTPYPFMNEKYGHAQFGWGGGMEHQTMSSMGTFSEHLMSHELAHQWFGDKITCGSWSDIWLNEGFATYCTGLFYKHVATAWWRPWREDMINTITSLPDGSVYNSDTTNVNRIFSSRLSYKKGAFLLHMLTWKLGEADFTQAIRNYLEDINLAYKYATTPSLINHLEQVSAIDLTEFFNDWFYGEGYPSYQIVWNQNGSEVNFRVEQTQSHPSVSFYEMPIPIYISGQGMDTTLVFEHTFSGQHFQANVPFIVDSIVFDPELWILSKNNTVVVGIEEYLNESNVDVYPNPTKDIITIQAQHTIKNINVLDVLGNQLQIKEVFQDANKRLINLSNLKNGIYIIEIEFQEGIVRKRINKI
jgi:aminopeptidase N